MSTLEEIVAAADQLPKEQLKKLLRFMADKVGRNNTDDPFDAAIGAFVGPDDATGRCAEEILYGRETDA